jgi:hypothetical protein
MNLGIYTDNHLKKFGSRETSMISLSISILGMSKIMQVSCDLKIMNI